MRVTVVSVLRKIKSSRQIGLRRITDRSAGGQAGRTVSCGQRHRGQVEGNGCADSRRARGRPPRGDQAQVRAQRPARRRGHLRGCGRWLRPVPYMRQPARRVIVAGTRRLAVCGGRAFARRSGGPRRSRACTGPALVSFTAGGALRRPDASRTGSPPVRPGPPVRGGQHRGHAAAHTRSPGSRAWRNAPGYGRGPRRTGMASSSPGLGQAPTDGRCGTPEGSSTSQVATHPPCVPCITLEHTIDTDLLPAHQ